MLPFLSRSSAWIYIPGISYSFNAIRLAAPNLIRTAECFTFLCVCWGVTRWRETNIPVGGKRARTDWEEPETCERFISFSGLADFSWLIIISVKHEWSLPTKLFSNRDAVWLFCFNEKSLKFLTSYVIQRMLLHFTATWKVFPVHHLLVNQSEHIMFHSF